MIRSEDQLISTESPIRPAKSLIRLAHLYRRNRRRTIDHGIATLPWVVGVINAAAAYVVTARTDHAVHPQRRPICRAINHHIVHVLIAAQRVQDGPHVLVDLQGLRQSSFTRGVKEFTLVSDPIGRVITPSMTLPSQKCRLWVSNPVPQDSETNTYLHNGHRQLPRSQFSCR